MDPEGVCRQRDRHTAVRGRYNLSLALKGSVGGMGGSVLKGAVPGEDAVPLAKENLQSSIMKTDPSKQGNSTMASPLPPGGVGRGPARTFAQIVGSADRR